MLTIHCFQAYQASLRQIKEFNVSEADEVYLVISRFIATNELVNKGQVVGARLATKAYTMAWLNLRSYYLLGDHLKLLPQCIQIVQLSWATFLNYKQLTNFEDRVQ